MIESEWKRVVNEWQNGNDSMSEYCRKRSLSYWSFRSWKKKFEAGNLSQKNPGLVKLSHIPGKPSVPTTIEIHFGEIRVCIPGDFDEKHLGRIISVLQKSVVL